MALGSCPHSLPRLHASCYRADAAILWTLTTINRTTGWVNERLHFQFRELLLHAAARHALLCPVYTLMPDHIHLAWIGTRLESDQRNAMAFLRTHLEPLIAPARFQHQPRDHVLATPERTHNAFLNICEYILLNPVRGGLARNASDWLYSGCLFVGYANVSPFNKNYWPWFWKIFNKQRDLSCDKHVIIREVNGGKDSLDDEAASPEP
jgi:putative transposase